MLAAAGRRWWATYGACIYAYMAGRQRVYRRILPAAPFLDTAIRSEGRIARHIIDFTYKYSRREVNIGAICFLEICTISASFSMMSHRAELCMMIALPFTAIHEARCVVK